jgi:hypothetical protein
MGDEVEREDGGCTGKRGRVESKGGRGRVTDQHNRHCQPTQLFPVLRLYPSPGPGPDHSYSPPPSHFSYCLIVSAHTAPSVIPPLSGQLHSPRHRLLLPHPVLCSFATSSALHRIASQARLRTQWRGAPPALAPYPNRCPVLLQTLQGTTLVPS